MKGLLFVGGICFWLSWSLGMSFWLAGIPTFIIMMYLLVGFAIAETKILYKALRGTVVLGATLNFLCIASNSGKMPVFPYYGWVVEGHVHSVLNASSHLTWLADIIPANFAILSVGDLLIFIPTLLGSFLIALDKTRKA